MLLGYNDLKTLFFVSLFKKKVFTFLFNDDLPDESKSLKKSFLN